MHSNKGSGIIVDEANSEVLSTAIYTKLDVYDYRKELKGKELKEELNAQILDALEFGTDSSEFYVRRFMRRLERKRKVKQNDAWRSTHKSFRKSYGN